MYKKYYRHFLKSNEKVIHLAAHSHHFWPDCTKDAALKSWEDSAKFTDDKWSLLLGEVVPKAQSHIARILNLSHPEQIAFAPNTHELLSRLFSCFTHKPTKLLTTSSEFHSLSRQVNRLNELNNFESIIIDNEAPNFKENFLRHISDVDIIFISHVFFNSGRVLDLNFIKEIVALKREDTILCLDGYHGFCAIPTDIKELESSIFYLAGGYKYAQAGEGACFMTIPRNCKLRPLNTGWFASFESLSNPPEKVMYSDNGMRFWGATQDLTPWYRFNSVWDLFQRENIEIEQIHKYIKSLQIHFLNKLKNKTNLLTNSIENIGHFITLDFKSCAKCDQAYSELKKAGVLTDYRGSRLRFGFGMYLDSVDIDRALKIINHTLD